MIMLLVDLLQCSTVLTAIIVGFALNFVNARNRTECDDRRELCYFYTDIGLDRNWSDASNLCRRNNLTLPVILNRREQIDFENILTRFEPNIEEVWTAGKQHSYGEFTWINGQVFNRKENVEVGHYLYTHMKVNRSLHFIADDPRRTVGSFCQFSGEKCSSNNSNLIQLSTGCLKKNDDEDLSWYQARTRCVDAGGDLAVLENENLTFLGDRLGLIRGRYYWIGLRNYSFRWSSDGASLPNIPIPADIKDEIKYNNFSNNTHFGIDDSCVSINPSDGQWNVVRCKDGKHVVCQRRLVPWWWTTSTRTSTTPAAKTSSTTKTMTTKRTSTSIAAMTSSTTTATNSKRTSTSTSANEIGNTQSNESSNGTVLVAAAAIGAIVVIVCIIIIIVVVMKRRRSEESECGTETGQNGQNTRAHMYENRQQTSTDNQCQYAAINQGQYAEIPLLAKPVQVPEASGNNQQPGIEYASIDFQKDPKNEESTNRSKPVTTNVGPQGNQVIYAEPVRKSIAKDHSPGNVVPTKVGPLGDTYALPSTHHGSSNAKSPKEHHYANINT